MRPNVGLEALSLLCLRLLLRLLLVGLVLLVVLCLPALRRRGRSARVAVGGLAVLVVAASFAWALAQSVETPTVAYFSTATRA